MTHKSSLTLGRAQGQAVDIDGKLTVALDTINTHTRQAQLTFTANKAPFTHTRWVDFDAPHELIRDCVLTLRYDGRHGRQVKFVFVAPKSVKLTRTELLQKEPRRATDYSTTHRH